MSTLGVKVEALATDVSFTKDSLRVALNKKTKKFLLIYVSILLES